MRRAALAFALLASPAYADDPAPTVTTHATARDRLPNTVADVQLGIETHARAVAEIRTALSAGSVSLTDFLRGAGAERVRTENLTVQPDLDDDPGQHRPPRILGYTGSLSISFEIAPDKLGATLADALTHGANTIQGTSLHPRVAEIDAAHQRLAAAAARIAMDEARAVAEAAGMKAGPPRQIIVEGAQPFARMMAPAPMMAARMAAPAPPPMTTEAGDSEITVSVTTVVTLVTP